MRRLLLTGPVLLVLAVAAWADGNVRIVQVGLNGHCVSRGECSVLAEVSNPYPKPLDVELQVGVVWLQAAERFDVRQTYIHHLTLAARESREIEAPFRAYDGAWALDLTVRLPGGSILGHDRQEIASGRHYLVGVLCREEALSKVIQAQIELSGSAQDRIEKNNGLELAGQLRPRSQWWAYAGASTIVVAIPTGPLSGEERSALEWFARSGRNLVLLEEELADPTFLAEYRQGPPAQDGVSIGGGRLFRILRLSDQALEGWFSRQGEDLGVLERASGAVQPGAGLNRAIQHAAAFPFPSWRELLAWLSTYVLLVGVVNFGIRRRLRRREWGWLTVAGVALLFVFALYRVAAHRGPQQVMVDYGAHHYMDSRSNRAFTSYGLRVSVPRKQELILKSPANALLSTELRREHRFSTVQLGRQLTRGWDSNAPEGWDPLPNSEMVIPTQGRTNRHLSFLGTTTFPGTVHETARGRLRNDTGQRFVNAIFVDTVQMRIWPLGEVAPGAEIDLSKARYQTFGSCASILTAWRNLGFKPVGDDLVLSVCQAPGECPSAYPRRIPAVSAGSRRRRQDRTVRTTTAPFPSTTFR